jgi:hypothetical protein
MQSRNGRSSPPGGMTGGGSVHARPEDGHPASEDLSAPPGAGDDGLADDNQVILPALAVPHDSPAAGLPGQPAQPAPPKLPKRPVPPDPSKPSVPHRQPRSQGPAAWTEPPEPFAPLAEPAPPAVPLSRPAAAGLARLPEPPQGSGRPGPPSAPGRQGAPPAGQAPAPQPAWGTVIATTVRLWLQRHLGWLRRLWPARALWRVVIVAALVVAILAAGVAAVELTRPSRARQAPGATPAAAPAAAAARQQAAAWLASQANPDAVLACDPAMCAALQARGIPAGRLLMLTPSSADPLGSDLVVATPAVRSQFGARLAGVYAPVTLATFGSGAARIDVRAMAPDGAAAYRKGLAADIRARKAAGALMLHNSRIHVAAAARAALAAGEVDPRLLVTLVTLAHLHPLDIAGFGHPSPGASAGVPLRSADIAGATVRGSHRVSLRALMAILRAQRPPYLPSSLVIVRIPPGGAVLRIGYPVPSPLGLLGSG